MPDQTTSSSRVVPPQPAVLTRDVTPTAPREQRAARILLGIALLGLGVFVLEGFLRALVWAAVLAVATWPLYFRVQSRMPLDKHNIMLPLLFTTVSIMVVLVPLALLAWQAGHEARTIAGWIRAARENGAVMPEALAQLPAGQAQFNAWWADNLAKPEDARALLGRLDSEMMVFGRSYGSRILHTAVSIVFTFLTLFFLYREGPSLGPQLMGVSRQMFGSHGERVSRQIVASIHGTVDGLVMVGLGTGFILGIGYAVAGVPHPALLGAASAVGAMVPLGATIMLVIACMLALAAGKTLTAITLFALGFVVIFVADHFVRPTLIGGATKLPFLWVLLGILGGVESFGLLGLFVGPAVMAALILLWREWVGDGKSPA